MSETPDDTLARMRAEADQARAGTYEVAQTVAAFYSGLRKQGLKRRDAVKLTNTFLQTTLTTASAAGMMEDLFGREDPE